MKTKAAVASSIVGLLALAGALVVAPSAVAHEGHRHQEMGTVAAIDAAKLVLAPTEGENRTFLLSAATRYLRGGSEVRREDVTTGERAVVVYETKAGADQALEVKLAEKQP
jgi:hypothetical protein